MLIYAHRGWHGGGIRTNTMAAFARAAAEGFGIETDLRTTRDGGIVLFHDRCVAGQALEDVSFAQLCELAGFAVPTLAELLAAAFPVPLNLEVKTPRAAAALVAAHAAALRPDMLVSAFDHALVMAIGAQCDVQRGFLSASRPLAALPMPARETDAAILDYNMVRPELDAGAAARRIVYGPVTADEHRLLARAGLHAVITDYPLLARAAIAGG